MEELTKAQISARRRWANTNAEERARLGELHRSVMKKYHASRTPEERSMLARKAARGRWVQRVKKGLLGISK